MSTQEDPLGIVGKWFHARLTARLVEVISYNKVRDEHTHYYNCVSYSGDGRCTERIYYFPDPTSFIQLEM